MSKDRLEQALEEMKNENVSPEELAGARGRVWENLSKATISTCSEFQPSLGDYLEGRLTGSRRLLTEDHLSRCTRCRALLAELRGEPKVVRMPTRRARLWPRWGTWAAAAALAFMGIYLTRDRIDEMLAPDGPRATVASVSGGLYRVPGGMLQVGATIDDREIVRTGQGSRATLRLADGSLMEINENTEVRVLGAWSGHKVQLERGDIIVQAAKQRRGRLQVRTRDSVASVRGTVFAVSTGLGGTVVSVVEGSVAVAQPGVEVVLHPGQQSASTPALASSVEDAVSWSPDAEEYTSLLASIAELEREIAALPFPGLRTQSRLVQYLPDNVMAYGAIPNLGGTIDQALALAEQQAVESPVFGGWWNSDEGIELRQIIDCIQTVTPVLGEEIILAFATTEPIGGQEIVLVAAEVLPGKQAELRSTLDELSNQTGGDPLAYTLTDTIIVATESPDHLQWVMGHLGQGANSSFAGAISERYQHGVGILFALDLEPALAVMSGAEEAKLAGLAEMKHLFIEQRDLHGNVENAVTLTFDGPRKGLASWLASTGSGGAAEYLSSGAIFALYVSMREPRQLFDELVAQLGTLDGSSVDELAQAETEFGISFADDLAAALGTEAAFALEGFSVVGPVWVLSALVHDPTTLDSTILTLVDKANSELGPEDEAITIVQETADGRDWTTLQSGFEMLSVTWTYDDGYLVAASDRGAALRAIATRNGGAALVWSAALNQQLPSSAGLHPSAFVWLNTMGALEGLGSLVTDPTLRTLIASRDPIMVVFSGTTEQIYAASRTGLTALIIDMMMLESVSGLDK